MKNIVFFGDSLTAGYGLRHPHLDALPALIQEKINDLNLPYKAINSGLSGETSHGGLARVDGVLIQPIDIFVLELGINDLLRGINYATTERNLEAIFEKVRIRNPDVRLVLLGMEVPAYIAGRYAAQFRAIFRNIALKYDAAFLPFLLEGVAGVPELNIGDGFHPSSKGYRLIAENVWEILKTIIIEENSLKIA